MSGFQSLISPRSRAPIVFPADSSEEDGSLSEVPVKQIKV